MREENLLGFQNGTRYLGKVINISKSSGKYRLGIEKYETVDTEFTHCLETLQTVIESAKIINAKKLQNGSKIFFTVWQKTKLITSILPYYEQANNDFEKESLLKSLKTPPVDSEITPVFIGEEHKSVQ